MMWHVTDQGAEALGRVSARDPRRVHFDAHVVLHGSGLGLAGVVLPHRTIVRAHQGLAQLVLAPH